ARRQPGGRMEAGRGFGEGEVGRVDDEERHAVRSLTLRILPPHDHGARVACEVARLVLLVGVEGDLPRSGRLERTDAVDQAVAVADQRGAELRGELREGDLHPITSSTT